MQLGEEAIHTGVVPQTVIRSGSGRVDCHRRHGSARRRCRGHGRARRGARPRVACRAERSRRAAACRSPEPTSPRARRCFAGSAADQPRHRSAGRDRCRPFDVWRKPIVAILSTGDEIIAPGEPMQPAKVYDSNAQVLADAVRELGGEPLRLGITHDDLVALRERLQQRSRRPPTSCCSRVARARARAMCRIASSPNCAIRASSRTASRSSPASRSASRRLVAGRSSCFPAFRRRRSSRFTSSWRR